MAFFRRLWNWCKRFRNRCGYGVHSPSDFFLITSVVYESLPYYAYRELESSTPLECSSFYRRKVNRLLFRLVNYFQPSFLVNVVGEDDLAFRYMKTACATMKTVDVPQHYQVLIKHFMKRVKLMEHQLFINLDILHYQ